MEFMAVTVISQATSMYVNVIDDKHIIYSGLKIFESMWLNVTEFI